MNAPRWHRSSKHPNLDEHFDAALFLFSDETARELMSDIQQAPVHKLPDIAARLSLVARNLVEAMGNETRGQLTAGILDQHEPEKGFFYALIGGRSLGRFDVLYDPTNFEQVSIGRGGAIVNGASPSQLWTSFRTRRSAPYKLPAPAISDYRIDSDIRPDLTLTAQATFKWQASQGNGRVIPLLISNKMKIESAEVDGQAAEVLQPSATGVNKLDSSIGFYVVAETALLPGSNHQITIRYQGSVIRRTDEGSYFVDDRNAWYPLTRPTLATFDLTFRCPGNLRLVSTGELVSDTVAGGIRTVHRVTRVPEALAGFNLGDYDLTAEDHGAYRIECFSNKTTGPLLADIPKQLGELLDYYSQRWQQPLPIHSVAVSPVPASFGQGFPGLIYLSEVTYVRPEDRPVNLRTEAMDQFFTELLLPHEVAHQWWGNMVTAAEYRSTWLMEALANYSALQFIERRRGSAEVNAVLDRYRTNLTHEIAGKQIDSYGPLEFGTRLADAGGMSVWHTITYEKGTWVMHMLRQRLGDEGFLNMQRRLLRDYAGHPISNEDFRKTAADFLPATNQPDKSLSLFFDTWVYGTGIPKLQMEGDDIEVSGVDDDFSLDVPLRCTAKGGAPLHPLGTPKLR